MHRIFALVLVLVLAGCNATQEELAQLGQSMQQVGQAWNPPRQQIYYAPQVQSFSPPPNRIVNCFQTGPMVHCR